MNKNIKKIIAITIVSQIFSCSAEMGAQAGSSAPSLNLTTQTGSDINAAGTIPGAAFADPTEQETLLGPWLDLHDGGISVGPAQGTVVTNPDGTNTGTFGSLVNGSLLPQSGTGFMRRSRAETSWGAGIMISLIENSAAYLVQNLYPDVTLYLGDIAQEHGGKYSPHSSHQSGLDADFYFVGNKKYQSVLDAAGNVTELFDVQKNWQYWRLLVNQKILEKGKPTSVVSMILVDPKIKEFLCQWTKDNNMREDPLDLEVLRRLRPTKDHDDHFHLRVKCSPYYLDCKRQGDVGSSIGCAN